MSQIETFIELDDAGFAEAMSGSRVRVYDDKVLSFLDSGKRGVEINLAEGVHQGKKAPSVKTGYESARERLVNGKIETATDEQKEAAKNTKVILKGDRVFLIRQDMTPAAATA